MRKALHYACIKIEPANVFWLLQQTLHYILLNVCMYVLGITFTVMNIHDILQYLVNIPFHNFIKVIVITVLGIKCQTSFHAWHECLCIKPLMHKVPEWSTERQSSTRGKAQQPGACARRWQLQMPSVGSSDLLFCGTTYEPFLVF